MDYIHRRNQARALLNKLPENDFNLNLVNIIQELCRFPDSQLNYQMVNIMQELCKISKYSSVRSVDYEYKHDITGKLTQINLNFE